MSSTDLSATRAMERDASPRPRGPEPHAAVRRRLALWGVLALAAGAMPQWVATGRPGLHEAATAVLLFFVLAALALFVALSLLSLLLRRAAELSRTERVAAVAPLLLWMLSLAVLWWAAERGLGTG